MPTTRTLEDGRLFPPLTWDNGWSLSLQADKAGYRCSPKERLPHLEDYETVEAKLDGPFPHYVDPSMLGLPDDVLAKFTPLAGAGPSLGCGLTAADVEAVKQAIMQAGFNPNAGVPRGVVGWSGFTVFHGTSGEDAATIARDGVDVGKSSGGYFGHAFYVAEDKELALSNYAEFSDGEGGSAVLEFCLADGAPILDLRNALDAKAWQDSGLDRLLGNPGLAGEARRLGIAGVYDRSVGGLAIFDPSVLGGVVRTHAVEAAEVAPGPR